jgi:acyl-CoA thioesterase 8
MSSISLMDSLKLAPTHDPDIYLSTTLWKPRGARGVFGGHVIALALVAAGKTIAPGMGLHSQHCYFVLPADPSMFIEFKVDRTRDGKSYSTRVVKALQKGKTVFVLAASYARAIEGEVPGQTPFSFIPSTQHVNKKEATPPVKPELKLSHSLRFAVGTTKDSTKDAQNMQGEELTGIGGAQERAWAIPPFQPRWFLPFPEGVSTFRESILEEVRWSKFLDKKAGTVDENAEKYIAEYIEVSVVVIAASTLKLLLMIRREKNHQCVSLWPVARQSNRLTSACYGCKLVSHPRIIQLMKMSRSVEL